MYLSMNMYDTDNHMIYIYMYILDLYHATLTVNRVNALICIRIRECTQAFQLSYTR